MRVTFTVLPDVASGIPSLDPHLPVSGDGVDHLLPTSIHAMQYQPYGGHCTSFQPGSSPLDLSDPSFPSTIDNQLHNAQHDQTEDPNSTSLLLQQNAQDVLTRDISAVLESTVETGIPVADGGLILQPSNTLREDWSTSLPHAHSWSPPVQGASGVSTQCLESSVTLIRRHSRGSGRRASNSIGKKSSRIARWAQRVVQLLNTFQFYPILTFLLLSILYLSFKCKRKALNAYYCVLTTAYAQVSLQYLVVKSFCNEK